MVRASLSLIGLDHDMSLTCLLLNSRETFWVAETLVFFLEWLDAPVRPQIFFLSHPWEIRLHSRALTFNDHYDNWLFNAGVPSLVPGELPTCGVQFQRWFNTPVCNYQALLNIFIDIQLCLILGWSWTLQEGRSPGMGLSTSGLMQYCISIVQ